MLLLLYFSLLLLLLVSSSSEKTVKLKHHVQPQGCFKDGCGFHNSPMIINVAIFGIIFELFGICVVLASYFQRILDKHLGFILLFLVLVIMLVGTAFFLSQQETSTQELSFKVPLLPWLPIVALFFNIYLILELSRLTWIRFGVWMAVGM